ncbi:nucleoside-diphosphate sugar epimerase [Nonomuraea sp. NPDC050394]|uniref:nucleoside-diphosphate sugar epimerase n=1 Tax=Nonomuraea sp. NPDC050394 TaxID=3364363 RepID=UPI0037BCD710
MCEILVTGASGDIGRHVFASLSAAGVPVRGLPGEDADLLDPVRLEPRLDGVETVFLVWPALNAKRAAPVIELIARYARRVVYLSSQTPTFHADIERLIEHAGPAWTFLRPGGLAAGTLAMAEQVKSGVVRRPYGMARRSLIHEKDVAAVATHVLASAGHGGVRYALSGPEALTQVEQVRILGEAAGREVRWEDLAPELARPELLRAWGDEEYVDAELKAWGEFVDSPEPVTNTVRVLTGREPRSFREWARDHADAFR